jgi:signal recognition particle subunit SEC65
MATAKKKPKMTQANKIREYARGNPSTPIAEVAKELGISYQAVYNVLKVKPNVKVPKQQWKTVMLTTSKEAVLDKLKTMPLTSARKAEIERKVEADHIFELTKGRDRVEMIEPQADNVNHPAHYKVGGIETIDFIEAKGLNYRLGNVVKYISRADHKGERLENLKKGLWYLEREIAAMSK